LQIDFFWYTDILTSDDGVYIGQVIEVIDKRLQFDTCRGAHTGLQGAGQQIRRIVKLL
jgi:hypothetical protein